MGSQLVTVFCQCDDIVKALYHHEDPQCQMTTAIIAALHFAGNFDSRKHAECCETSTTYITYSRWHPALCPVLERHILRTSPSTGIGVTN